MSDVAKIEGLRKSTAAWSPAEHALLEVLKGGELPDLTPKDRGAFLRLLIRHRLLVRYAHVLRAKYPDSRVAKQAAQGTRVYVKHQLQLTAEILKIGRIFDVEDVRYIALKGPVLSEILYRDVSQRQSTDIDLLVDPSEVAKCINILRQHNYDWQDNIDLADIQYFNTYLQLSDETTLVSSTENPIKIDLHWKITTPIQLFPKMEPTVWSHTEKFQFKGLEMNVLTSELNFIFLCLHGAKHKWFRLQWLTDISEYLSKELDWEEVSTTIHTNKIGLPICQAVLLTQVLFNREIPRPLASLIHKYPKAYSLCLIALKAIHNNESFMNAHDRANLKHLTKNLMSLKGGLAYKYHCLKRLFVSIQDWQVIRLPPSLMWMYIPLRPVLLLLRKL